ncbi:SDR family NAD(P)-dependent oxidoreductase [Propionivibrio sp.]|uniref:SDR family NAD(P)-dependent oxidoreductase n=1 Tax=Propionivibrio sp. TaxID=2212460 RepID=UPI0039E21820
MFADLKNRRVLITGSSQGIGLAAAKAFAAAGSRIGLNGRRRPDDIESTLSAMRSAGGEAEFLAADLRHSDQCEALVDAFVRRFGGIDVLVNNAGGLVGRKPLPEIDDDFFNEVVDLNIRSAVMVTKHALPHLKASAAESGQTASVILVGSIAGYLGGGPGASLYGAAKAWIHNVQKNWVTFHTKDGIRFNTVSPGTFDTAFHADKDAATRAKISAGIPMGRFGRPEEAAPAFLFFASHLASGYVTGQILDVNGGQYMP